MTRTQRIKDYIRSYPPEICMERGRIYTEEFFSHPERPLVIRRAEAFARYLREMTIYIGDDDLLVGNTASKPLAAGCRAAIRWLRKSKTVSPRTFAASSISFGTHCSENHRNRSPMVACPAS